MTVKLFTEVVGGGFEGTLAIRTLMIMFRDLLIFAKIEELTNYPQTQKNLCLLNIFILYIFFLSNSG